MSANGYGVTQRGFQDQPRHFTQAEKRERRRRRLTVTLDDGFDLGGEVAEITGPLGEAVAGSPTPHTHGLAVSGVADEVAEVVFVAVALLAEADAACRTAHIADLADRRRAMTMLTDRGAALHRARRCARRSHLGCVVGGTGRLRRTGIRQPRRTARAGGATR